MKHLTIASICLTLALVAAAGAAEETSSGARLSPDQIAADVLGAMDRSADPCVDFYQYACGTWVANAEIPPDQPMWARSFSVLRERNREIIRNIIEEAAATVEVPH